MNTGLTTIDPYEKVRDAESFVRSVGNDIARSRMFGCENEEQGRVLALECYARRQPPLMLAEQYHIINGRLSMKADRMLAGFEACNGKYEIKEYTADACEIVFRRGDQVLPIRITWEDAQKEKWPYGKGGKIKDNWETPLGRQDMLWARVVSRGVRRLAPSVVAGCYTPEEITDFDSTGPAPAPVQPQSATPPADETVDVPFEVVEQPAEQPQDQPATGEQSATGTQTDRIRQLYVTLNVPHEKQEQILRDRGCNALRNLTYQQADELIAKLEGLVDQSKVPDNATEMDTHGPVDQVTIDQIREAIRQAVQTGMPDLADEVRAKLEASNLSRLADLTFNEARLLLACVQQRSMAAFFDADLMGYKPKPEETDQGN